MSSRVMAFPLIDSLGLLIKGIEMLGLAIKELRELRDHQGRVHKVDKILVNEKGEQIGIRQDTKGKVEFVLADERSATAKATVDKVTQAYSRLKVLEEVQKKGYRNVKEEKLPDGTIRLVVEKWQ